MSSRNGSSRITVRFQCLSVTTRPLAGGELAPPLVSFRRGVEAAAFDGDESEAVGATRVQIALK
jgi:hypothetical protein